MCNLWLIRGQIDLIREIIGHNATFRALLLSFCKKIFRPEVVLCPQKKYFLMKDNVIPSHSPALLL